ncbi:uncharacterized protein LOC111042460 [Myzus persicae]|uniref:uncharacterized protein LOC111042460 n=1 Tax=Myzus persicae TaxID=13164 RepID=UPI000B9392C9|nr:uncharacterized protein LOC111042460 [Myzus persicae]
MSENKRKGGAQKTREKNKKLLFSQANKCRPISELFSIPPIQKSNNCTTTSNTTISNAVNDCSVDDTFLNTVDVSNQILSNNSNSDEVVNCKDVNNTLNILEKENVMKVCALVNADVDDDKDIVMVEDVDNNNLLDNNFTLNYFQKPMLSSINDFFKYHPKQPHVEKLFKSSKAYFRSNSIKRQWLSFDNQSKSLFCSVCLAFSSEPNLFTKGLSVWTHVYQRIEEHEASKTHMSCSESYLLHTSNKTINILLFSDFKKKKKEEIKKNIQILQRVIDIVKLIGKRGLSYRAHRNESALSLNNPILDHGNFLDILLLLKKYDIVLNEHVDSLTNKAQRKANSGNSKGKVSKVTFISKTTVNMVIDSISTLIKKNISSQILEALMFSVQMDTTQDVSVQDQCSLIL